MDDFIYNLRNNSHKRYDGNRKHYDGNNRNYDRNKSRDKKSGFHQQKVAQEVLSTIKPLLEEIVDSHKRTADANERRATAEEQKAAALISIAEDLKTLTIPENTKKKIDKIATVTPSASEDMVQKDQSAANTTKVDHDNVLDIIHEMREEKISYEKIARHLMSEGIPTSTGKYKWTGQTVSRLYNQ